MLSSWKGQKIVVLGLSKSGTAVAKLLHQLGASVLVNDSSPTPKESEVSMLRNRGIPVILGHHPVDIITDELNLVVKNPGIPYDTPPIQIAIQKKIPVVTEVEIAYQVTSSPIIGITGSNGKTTTTTLVGQMLYAAKISSRVAGNIGQALSEIALITEPEEWLVTELSSFQLKGTLSFRPRIAALLNITPAHLDYHGDLADYIHAKWKLFSNQQIEDVAILNHRCQYAHQVKSQLISQIYWFSLQGKVNRGVYVEDGWIRACINEEVKSIISLSEVRVKGVFLENLLAASTIALVANCPIAVIRDQLAGFSGIEHRMEFVLKWNDIAFFNDSKATNVQSTSVALQSFPEQSVVLIAGGLDRGFVMNELVPIFRKHVRAIVAYGQAAPILLKRAAEAGVKVSEHVLTVPEAVKMASQMARPGDIVLMSPACASWDQHHSFEERGSMFKQAVHNLI